MSFHRFICNCLTTLAIIFSTFSSSLFPASETLVQGLVSTAEKAEEFYQQGRWKEAAEAYSAILQTDPSNTQALMRLGAAHHALGNYDKAADVYRRVLEKNSHPVAVYNLACASARLGEKEKAFELLDQLIAGKAPVLRQISSEEDFAALRGDARFDEVLKKAARIATPCLVRAEYSQFDFWTGEWEVRNPQGQIVGHNSVQKVADGCLILENWTDRVGGSGKSLNYFDVVTGKWHQKWMGSQGNALELVGEYKDNAMRYTGVTAGRDGKKTQERLTFFRLDENRVRQLWEQSSDEDQTWTTIFDGMYLRKKASAAR
jgi:tetratricopeptide (TPR) repeat protein